MGLIHPKMPLAICHKIEQTRTIDHNKHSKNAQFIRIGRFFMD